MKIEVLNPNGNAPWPQEAGAPPEIWGMNPYSLFEKALFASLSSHREEGVISALSDEAITHRTFALWANGNG